ncbi:MAG: MerR family transcriptional regulator [Lachnospiraceae bacterium]|nr:MerR family transcriptional regulator [Lachnospiraceae bacterium]
MKLKINEVAKLTGITVRTLHYYDEIGLLSPSEVTEAGYRLYDERALHYLQQILFFRELDFQLNQIKEIVTDPTFNANDALKNHQDLLTKKRDRIDKLIKLVKKTIKGGTGMSFKEFDISEIEALKEKYATEVKEHWGHTAAYAESTKKTKNYDTAKWNELQKVQDSIFLRFAESMGKEPSHTDIQALVKERQDFITNNFYVCSNEMLQELAQMNLTDERFKKNIDKFADGLTEFIAKATDIYCKQA